MKNVTCTMCDAAGPCEECGQLPEHAYQFSVYGSDILLCGRCIDTFVTYVITLLQKVEAELTANTITLPATNVSELRCSKCMDMLAAHLSKYRSMNGRRGS
jgi:hypothetical protein